MGSFKPSQESKEEFIQRLLRKYEEALRQNLTEGPQTLEEMEREVGKIGKQVQKDLQTINSTSTVRDTPRIGSPAPAEAGLPIPPTLLANW